jgi:hypothetical protein
LPGLLDLLANFDGSPEYINRFQQYSVNRSDEQFWALYDWFQTQLTEIDPVQAGLYDLNRYYNHALAQ